MEENTIFIFPTKGFCEILFFQNKQELLKSVAAHPDIVIPILGGDNDTDLDNMFSNVYCALRKTVDGVSDVSCLSQMVEQSAQNLFATQQ
ncbi:MAG: hypothetical protein IJZ64_03130 [Ruminococcus sp.]|nr:hypothetical protein [Ruminococcus sp.]